MMYIIYLIQGSHIFWSADLFILLKHVIHKEILFMQALLISIYYERN
jgi:hypothetical protein